MTLKKLHLLHFREIEVLSMWELIEGYREEGLGIEGATQYIINDFHLYNN